MAMLTATDPLVVVAAGVVPQLVEEMQREAGVAFYMFTLTGFFYQAQRHDLLIEHRALKELEANLREREAQMARDQEMLAAGGIRAEYVALKNLVTLFGQEADPASVRFFDRYIAHSKERLAALEQRILAEDIESGAVEVLNTPVEEGEAETQL